MDIDSEKNKLTSYKPLNDAQERAIFEKLHSIEEQKNIRLPYIEISLISPHSSSSENKTNKLFKKQ